MKKSEIEKAYKSLENDVKTNDYYTKIDLTNRVNCYVCSDCGHIIKTKDIAAGVTPFIIWCEKCQGAARSSFYNDIAPSLEPTHEWYRPSLEETLSAKQGLQAHILQGGLNYRKITKENEKTN